MSPRVARAAIFLFLIFLLGLVLVLAGAQAAQNGGNSAWPAIYAEKIGEALIVAAVLGFAFEIWIRRESAVEMRKLFTYDEEVIRRTLSLPGLNTIVTTKLQQLIADRDVAERLAEFLRKRVLNDWTIATIAIPRFSRFHIEIAISKNKQSARSFDVRFCVNYTRRLRKGRLCFAAAASQDSKRKLLNSDREWICMVDPTGLSMTKISENYSVVAHIGAERLIEDTAARREDDQTFETAYVLPPGADPVEAVVRDVSYEITTTTHLAENTMWFALPVPAEGSDFAIRLVGSELQHLRASFIEIMPLGSLSVDQRDDSVRIVNTDLYMPGSRVLIEWQEMVGGENVEARLP